MVGQNNNEKIVLERIDQAEQILRSAMDEFHPNIILASSFSPEDIILMHMISKIRADARVFAIDTGRLNEETYQCAEAVRQAIGLKIEWIFPQYQSVQSLEQDKGLYSFKNSLEERHECCQIRKVEPLSRALREQQAWITGLRRDQSVTRTDLKHVELDETHDNITKVNPLLDWDDDDVWDYIKKHRLPYNSLHDHGYPSIGCAPCTRAVQPGEHPRAGRWWWENPENKECGLHVAYPVQSAKPTSS